MPLRLSLDVLNKAIEKPSDVDDVVLREFLIELKELRETYSREILKAFAAGCACGLQHARSKTPFTQWISEQWEIYAEKKAKELQL